MFSISKRYSKYGTEIKSYLNVLLGILVSALVVTPILLGSARSRGETLKNNLVLCFISWSIAGILSWRVGPALGAGSTIIIIIATVFLSSSVPGAIFWDFIFILLVIATVILSNARILKWVIVLTVGILAAIIQGSLRSILIVIIAAIFTAFLATIINLVGDEMKQIFKSVQGGWGPVLAYLSLSASTVLIFALWYSLAFFYWPNSAFNDVPDAEYYSRSTWLESLPIFLYQSLYIFVTEGPPFPPGNGYTRALVMLEICSSIILLGLYLSLLMNYISKKGGGS